MKILAMLMLFVSAHAFAATSDGVMNYDLVESFYQAHENQFVVNLSPSVSHLAIVSDTSSQTIGTQTLGFGVEYGISKTYSLSVSDDYGSYTYQGSSGSYTYGNTSSGTSNILVALKGNWDLGAADKITGQFSLSISPGNATQTNRFYGGNSYTPQIGYQHKVNQDSLAAVIFTTSYSGKSTQETSSGNYTSDPSWSSSLYGNYETNFSGNKFGGLLGLNKTYSGLDFSTFLLAGIYGVMPLTKDLSISPALTYLSPTDALLGHKNGVKEYDIVQFAINARYAF